MNRIKEFRKERGITLDELAELSNLSSGYISHLENGTRKNPSYSVMKKIAESLNKNIFEVFKD